MNIAIKYTIFIFNNAYEEASASNQCALIIGVNNFNYPYEILFCYLLILLRKLLIELIKIRYRKNGCFSIERSPTISAMARPYDFS